MSGSTKVVEVSLPDKTKVLEVREEFLGELTSVKYILDGELKDIDDLPVAILKQLLNMRTREAVKLRENIDSSINLLRSKNYFPIPKWFKDSSISMAHKSFEALSRDNEEVVLFVTSGGANKALQKWIASSKGEDMRRHEIKMGSTQNN